MVIMIFKYILPMLAAAGLNSETFETHTKTFTHNEFFYRSFLSTNEPLTDLGRLHLLGLRLLIDIRLQDQKGIYVDSNEIFEMTENNKYLRQEFYSRYQTK